MWLMICALTVPTLYLMFQATYWLVKWYWDGLTYERNRGKYLPVPEALKKNNYPIVLVHGFFGQAKDKSYVMGDMWELAKKADTDVYVALVSMTGAVHDRSCELYQQLVGINQVRKDNLLDPTDDGPNLARAVYGHKHFEEEHPNQPFFKPRVLRKYTKDGECLAYPDGIPEGFSS